MQFEKGKVFRFETDGLFYNAAGYAYISLKGSGGESYRVRALMYQEDWGEIPPQIECFVLQEDPLILTQSRSFVLRDRYPQKNVWHTFFVKGVSTDTNTGKKFYDLKDEFGLSHRYYPTGGEVISSDKVQLWVSGVSAENGSNTAHLYLSLSEPAAAERGSAHDAVDDYSESEIPGGEGQKAEFKSSLVYPAGTTSPDIDAQTKIIMQSLAGMMNADGGTLYLGVNDDGNIRSGIENDFAYLNSSRYDDHTYKTDSDGYTNKIYSSIMSYLGGYAKTLSKVEIKTSVKPSAARYAVITVQSSAVWPVWVRGTGLFVRTGNNTTHLFGDEITQFFWKRFSGLSSMPAVPEVKEEEDEQEQHSTQIPGVEPLTPVRPPLMSPAPDAMTTPVVRATTGLFENERHIGYLYFLRGQEKDLNARVVLKKDVQPDKYEFRVPLPTSYEDYELVICYENGYTDWINIENALFTGNGKAKKAINFEWKSGKAIINAFCVKNNQKTKDLVAYVSTKDGIPYVKCNVLTSLAKNPHKLLDNSGNMMLENGSELKYALRVSGDKNSRMLLEDLGIIYEDRNNHRNGRAIQDLPEKSKRVLAEIIDLYLCSVQKDESLVVEDIITVPTTEPESVREAAPGVIEEDSPMTYDAAWILQGEKSFFVKGPAFAQWNVMGAGSSVQQMDGFIRLWDLDEATPFYVVKFKNSILISEYSYNQIFKTIIKSQLAFLNTGDPTNHARLSQKEVAEAVGLNDGTISRALDVFIIMAPGGIFKKGDLLAASGVGEVSEARIVQMIKEIRDARPNAGDQELTDEINRLMGTNIARRTIAKYRERAGIPNSRGKH